MCGRDETGAALSTSHPAPYRQGRLDDQRQWKSATVGRHQSAAAASARDPGGEGAPLGRRGAAPWASGWASAAICRRVGCCDQGHFGRRVFWIRATFNRAAVPSCGASRITGESEQSHGEPSGALPSSQSTSSARKQVTDGSSGGSLQKSHSPDMESSSSELPSDTAFSFSNMPSTLPSRPAGGRELTSKRRTSKRFLLPPARRTARRTGS
eukprot:scaffold73619_cov75-Phaeocystis_antarctica.AAC.4